MKFPIIIILAVVYPLAHGMNAWVFDFANINSHVSLIYLPAFLRLFHILVMGPFYGTMATLLGGFILMAWFDESLSVAVLNIAASCAGPLVALMGFRIYFKRRVQLTSLKDLAIVTVAYAMCNSLLHHATWLFIDIDHFFDASTSLWMFIGDLNGALLGAYLFKAILDYLGKKGFNFSTPTQPKN